MEVTCAIIIRKGRVLATRRAPDMAHPLKWEFPGGKLKKGESPAEGIVREILEELGVEVSVIRALSPVEHHYGSHPVRLIPLLCRLSKGDISLREHMEYRWFSCAEMEGVEWLEADMGVVEKVKPLLCN